MLRIRNLHDKRPCRGLPPPLSRGEGRGEGAIPPGPLQGYPLAVGLPPRPLRPTPSPNRVPLAHSARIIMCPHCHICATLQLLPPAWV